MTTLASRFRSLTIVQRLAFALMVLAAVNLAVLVAAGATDLQTHAAILVVAMLLFFFSRVRLWRVRDRLLVSYVLFGVVPLALVLLLAHTAATTLFGLVAAERVRRGLDDRAREAHALARELATVASSRGPLDVARLSRLVTGRQPGARAVVRINDVEWLIPDETGPLGGTPAWSAPEFRGLFELGDAYFIGASAASGSQPAAEVFVYAPLDRAALAGLTSEAAALALVPFGDDVTSHLSVGLSGSLISIERGGVRTPVEYSPETGLPRRRGLWDPALGWAVTRPVVRSSGERDSLLLTFVSRPSLLMPRLADPSDIGPPLLAFLALVLGGFALFVIAGATLWSAHLTRTITRSVHDLHEGTRQVAAGNLTHRTRVRGNDQLSELASSFNGMTERVQQLIVEAGERKKLESELEIARRVQLQLFPKSVPRLATLELAAACIPGRFVSGDYYDYVSLTGSDVALALGDVSGKGVSAALVMATLQAALHAQLGHGRRDNTDTAAVSTAALMGRLSEQLYANTPSEKYATFFCGTYDDRTGVLLYTNAGHLPPLLIRQRETVRLEAGGTVIGLMPIFSYDEQSIELERGDLLAMFTDGVTEAEDASGEQFGDERLTRLLIEHKATPLEQIVGIVTERVRAWAHDPDNADDTTILLARRIG